MGSGLSFVTPTRLTRWRVDTLFTKEPETLEWIDSLPEEHVLWDIGANIGLYSCYAAATKGAKVFAFEPSVLNIELLARNVFESGLQDKVTIIPLPLTNVTGTNTFHLGIVEWGEAQSTFGEDYGFDGKPMMPEFEYSTLGVTGDIAVSQLGVPSPDYIKIDVDGIEHLILSGLSKVLGSVKGILVEINDEFHEQSTQSIKILTQAGFSLSLKTHSEEFETGIFSATYNQIWEKK